MMDFINAHASAIMVGCIFANGYLASQAQTDSRWGWFALHIVLALACCAWLA